MDWVAVWSRITGAPRRVGSRDYREELQGINRRRAELRSETDNRLRALAAANVSRLEAFALTCEAARRTLGLDPFDVQVIGGLVMADGHIAEMQTGEGKTLAATLPACGAALGGRPVHVLTANEYLARRDARWMEPVYRLLGLSVGFIEGAADIHARKTAYACHVTYASATEVGFDFLRDQLRREPEDLVQRPFGLGIVDEVDSILIDEARIPLVIAGGRGVPARLTKQADLAARRLLPGLHYEEVGGLRVVLTEAGAAQVEALLGCGNLFEAANALLLASVSQALHAHALLARDVDYIVQDGEVRLIDEQKGRVAPLRRWPEGLQAAVEAKEGVEVRHGGRILGSITLQSFVALYPEVCGMTGTAATQATELREAYGLEVVVVPPNRPVIREDLEDLVFATRGEKQAALVARIRHEHARQRPVLVGTASVAESEGLSRSLRAEGVHHQVLNARNEEAEAAIIAQAGRLGAVTISTNMAGRGTDILLGGDPPVKRDRVVALGGLLVLGTNRHESRRIDNQLRGRAGRQGDPGESQFLLSVEDDLFQRFGLDREADVDHAQRMIEGQHLDIRLNLQRYERIVELQRRIVHAHRRAALVGEGGDSLVAEAMPERYAELQREIGVDALRRLERDVTLTKIDEGWSQYLEEVGETREDAAWVSLSGVPLHEYQRNVARMFDRLWERIDAGVLEAFASGAASTIARSGAGTGATWTYQTNDQAFPDAMERLLTSVRRLLRRPEARP
jgi:preprotein translocase subunit SecA